MLKRRILMSLGGVFCGAIAVSFFKVAAFGVDPFQSFMSGIDKLIPISFGTLYVIVNAVLLIFSLVTDRKNIGIATFINLFLLGYITEYSLSLLRFLFPSPGIILRILCMIIGIVIICIGSALYMTAQLGVSTYDAIAIVMSHNWKLGRFKYIRICTDLVCVLVGVFLFILGGGKISEISTVAGAGTIITAFFMGPLIEFFSEKIARPLLQ